MASSGFAGSFASERSTAPTASFGTAPRFPTAREGTPGPGAHSLASAIGKQSYGHRRSCPAFSFGTNESTLNLGSGAPLGSTEAELFAAIEVLTPGGGTRIDLGMAEAREGSMGKEREVWRHMGARLHARTEANPWAGSQQPPTT